MVCARRQVALGCIVARQRVVEPYRTHAWVAVRLEKLVVIGHKAVRVAVPGVTRTFKAELARALGRADVPLAGIPAPAASLGQVRGQHRLGIGEVTAAVGVTGRVVKQAVAVRQLAGEQRAAGRCAQRDRRVSAVENHAVSEQTVQTRRPAHCAAVQRQRVPDDLVDNDEQDVVRVAVRHLPCSPGRKSRASNP